jgi:DNA-binding NarL/FixJ family response regulator
VLFNAAFDVVIEGLTTTMAEKLAPFSAKIDDNPWRELSVREREVLNLLGQGNTLAEIADRLTRSATGHQRALRQSSIPSSTSTVLPP